jgi:hypothetical protein
MCVPKCVSVYLRTEFHISSFNVSLVNARYREDEFRFQVAAFCFFYDVRHAILTKDGFFQGLLPQNFRILH